MTETATELSEEEFDALFPLLPNRLNPHAAWTDSSGTGHLFETHGDELAFVGRQDPRTAWTLVDSEDGSLQLLSGFHVVNRIGYLVSSVPLPSDRCHTVRLESVADAGDD